MTRGNMLDKDEEIEFAELEHAGGQHKTFRESCPTCFSENRLIKAKATVDKGSWPTYPPGINPSTYPNEL